MVEITKESIVKDYPEIVAAIKDEARVLERGRLAALDAMRTGSKGLDTLIDTAKTEGKMPSDIAMDCFNLIKEESRESQMVSALKRDGEFFVKAGDAPTKRYGDEKKDKAVNLLAKAFAANGERKK